MNFKGIIHCALLKANENGLARDELIKIAKLKPDDFDAIIDEIFEEQLNKKINWYFGLEIIKNGDRFKIRMDKEISEFLDNDKNRKFFEKKENFRKYKLVDLFAGCGGLTWGFYKNDFEIVETIENDRFALKTYNRNFNVSMEPKDITDLKVRCDLEEKWKNKVDVVIGGFPCQGYSMAGKRNPDDERNQLYKYTIDVIKRIKPKVFVLENVSGILSFREKDGSFVIDNILKLLSEIGYYCNFVQVDASNFGVAQKRKRIIFIGSFEKNQNMVDVIVEQIKEYREEKKSVKDVIWDLKDKSELKEINHVFTKHSDEMIKKIGKTKVGESVMENYKDCYRKLDWDEPALTVKENHGGVFIHPELLRVLTPRELARLQSFPDDFIFEGTKSQILKQIGNAVPCRLGYVIAKIIRKELELRGF